MTEAKWLALDDALAMLEAVKDRVSDRKLRLLACAGARYNWHLFADARALTAVETAERYADGDATVEELTAAGEAGAAAAPQYGADVAAQLARSLGWLVETICQPHGTMSITADSAISASLGAPLMSLAAAYHGVPPETWANERAAVQRAHARFVACIISFRPPEPLALEWLAWHGGTVMRLARAAYDDRTLPAGTLNPPRLALLADALEDAGCSDVGLLTHLRSPGPHVRGCQAVDRVLGKS